MLYARTLSVELASHVGKQVTIKGWLHNLRELGDVNFLIVRDAWGLVQCVIDRKGVRQLENAQAESIIGVTGDVVASPQSPTGVELHNCQVVVMEAVTTQLPFALHQKHIKANLDTFLNHAQIGLRHPKRKALLRLGAGVMAGFRAYLQQQQFTEIQSPKLVSSATEGGANVFAVDYFGQPAFLAQSPQLYKQMMVGIYERVFEVGPVFRAEPHNTSRHINEYVSLDVEFGFIKDHTTVMHLVVSVLRHILCYLGEAYQDELTLLEVALPTMPEEVPTLSFQQAQQLIYELHGVSCQGEVDLTPQQERWLGDWAKQHHHSDFLFVAGYPMKKRPFYTYPCPEDATYSNSFDLLFRGLELTSGGQRLHRYADYLAALEERSLPVSKFSGYLETFCYGMPPHGGFAIGLERFLLQLTGAANIREVTLFPRDRQRLAP